MRNDKKIFIISDYFADQISGGGELNDWELISLLHREGFLIKRVNSQNVNVSMIDDTIKEGYSFVVSNFALLGKDCIKALSDRGNYAIYEHDHKYLVKRNPALYENYVAPKEKIINLDFYASATTVFCQTSFHMDIVKKNLNIDNLVNLGGNLWSTEHLGILEDMSCMEKEETYAIVNYPNVEHKNTMAAIRFCQTKKIKYKLIDPCETEKFLRELGKHQALVFFPKTPETLSRITLEARMMGMRTITTKNIGAMYEPWFYKKGLDLIDEMRYIKKEEILKNVVDSLYE